MLSCLKHRAGDTQVQVEVGGKSQGFMAKEAGPAQ